jgi:hypothetical protein
VRVTCCQFAHGGAGKILFVVAFLFAATSCEKPSKPVAAFEHVAPSPVGTTQTVLQKTFPLKTSATFPFEIPAHAVRPHLHGIFESFVGQLREGSDETADLDFLVLNEEQYSDFAKGRPGEALFSVESSHNQAVNFDLPASLDQPVKYYLIFRSSTNGKIKKVVEANFRVDF